MYMLKTYKTRCIIVIIPLAQTANRKYNLFPSVFVFVPDVSQSASSFKFECVSAALRVIIVGMLHNHDLQRTTLF